MMKAQSYQLIANELYKIIKWGNNTNSDIPNIDDLYDYLQNQDGFDFDHGIEGSIYTLLDLYIDSKSHNFAHMAISYSYEMAEKDFQHIILMIEQGRVEELEKDIDLKERIRNIYTS